MRQSLHIFIYLGHPFVFLRLPSSDQPKFLAFSKKEEEEEVTTRELNHFALEIILLI